MTIYHCCSNTEDSTQNDKNEIIPNCARRKFELAGHDIIEAKWLPELNVVECQELCRKLEGCQYFVSTRDSHRQCQLKSGSAVTKWFNDSISPLSNAYSGPAECDGQQPNKAKYMIFEKSTKGLRNIFYILYEIITQHRILGPYSSQNFCSLFYQTIHQQSQIHL